MNRGPRANSFSLVEVVVAIAIISFTLVTLLGLFGVGLTTSQQSSADTMLASLGLRAEGDLRNGTNSLAGTTTTNYYYDSQGMATNVSGAPALYACQVFTTNASVYGVLPDVSTNLVQATFQFTWPANVPAGKRPYTNVIYGTVPLR